MRICVYGAASNIIDEKYIKATEELGEIMGKRGHGLVFGAGANGLMGAAARGMHKAGGEIIGVAPKFFNVDGVLFDHCTELLRPDTMRVRKQLLEELSDAFIITPGGIGTFDEFFEILTLKQLARHKKAMAIFNAYGYYDKLLDALNFSIKEGFLNKECLDLFKVFDNPQKLVEYLEDYKEADIDIYKLKEIK